MFVNSPVFVEKIRQEYLRANFQKNWIFKKIDVIGDENTYPLPLCSPDSEGGMETAADCLKDAQSLSAHWEEDLAGAGGGKVSAY